MKMKDVPDIVPDYVLDNVDKSGDCWIWTGARVNMYKKVHYGTIKLDGQVYYAHRIMWKYYVGDIPNGYYIVRKCVNGLCVNPEHMYISGKKGFPRGRIHGKDNNRAKLTEEQVKTIHELFSLAKYSTTVIGEVFNINAYTVSRIGKGLRWKHLELPPVSKAKLKKIQKQAKIRGGRGTRDALRKNSKLNPERVRNIRKLKSTGKYTSVQIAEIYNISNGYVYDIWTKKVWKDV